MTWDVRLHSEFAPEYASLPKLVRREMAAKFRLLEEFGPRLGRPTVDTLNGSRYANMKELRFQADNGVWRVAFAFDPARQAIVLVAGNKAGVNEQRFYKNLITRADARFTANLQTGGSDD
jgi:hypothetical protein